MDKDQGFSDKDKDEVYTYKDDKDLTHNLSGLPGCNVSVTDNWAYK